ncbi:hypothetical protein G7Y89_g11846 [Cudoniella acicularis]|uniref:Transcription factor domain-containing protein n=1 Tax=Cudoniella acicularis TaxID=354080 RepID=A0A8H4RCZ9_9HELO|nr:hypothetical protein G7Y89_g11846 [Cudoniella acicularis]
MGKSGELSLNEKILSLVITLSDRVKHLETKLDDFQNLQPRTRKRPALDEHESFHPITSLDLSSRRPSKQQRIAHPDIAGGPSNTRDDGPRAECDPNSNTQQGPDSEAEDAATVLEFLAWGRLKDSSLTSGLRDPPNTQESALYLDKDIVQTTQTWGLSPGSVSAVQIFTEPMQISQIQDILPSKEQAILLFEYHAEWLLFMHCSFHEQTLRQDILNFYQNDNGILPTSSSSLQWAALLFSVMCGSITCAKPAQIREWGFLDENQIQLSKQWYQASVDCLNAARYQQNHCLFGVQTITSSTICAHLLGFSNSQSVMLASAIRIAQSLGLHRLPRPNQLPFQEGDLSPVEFIQREIGRRVWQQLTTQDWFSVPFSETYCVNPLHFTTNPPIHFNEDTMQNLPLFVPSIVSYGNFLFHIAALMPALLDQSSKAQRIEAKYDETVVDASWPRWVVLARRCLTVTSAHKIIMIHRRFLGMSFHDERYSFTRRTCLAAAKTIINEVKQDLPDESPILWTMQAFSVAAAIILSLDNFNSRQSAREHAEHRQLVSDTISVLSGSVIISSIASRGTRLLAELLEEEQKHTQGAGPSHNLRASVNHRSRTQTVHQKANGKSLNVSEFVRKFCQSDQPLPGNSPIATSHMPLWLQQDSSFYSYSDGRGQTDNGMMATSTSKNPTHSRFNLRTAHDTTNSSHRRDENSLDPFTQNISDSFDIRSMNWFDDLLGLAPSNSI